MTVVPFQIEMGKDRQCNNGLINSSYQRNAPKSFLTFFSLLFYLSMASKLDGKALKTKLKNVYPSLMNAKKTEISSI